VSQESTALNSQALKSLSSNLPKTYHFFEQCFIMFVTLNGIRLSAPWFYFHAEEGYLKNK